MPEDRVLCQTPNKPTAGTRIPRWKFDAVRTAILTVLAEGEMTFLDLTSACKIRMADADLAKLGSLGWHVTTVKLELECRGEIARVPGSKPQLLTLVEAGKQ
jgi:hypothetical protein